MRSVWLACWALQHAKLALSLLAGTPLYVWDDGKDILSEGLVRMSLSDFESPEDMDLDEGPSSSRVYKTTHVKTRILSPESKLAFCFIPKVASAQFNKMFGDLNGKRTTTDDNAPDFHSSTPGRLQINWEEVRKEEGWRFAYFTRDPLERYLSAFGSKCMVNSHGTVEGRGANCFGEVLWKPEPMDVVVEMFEKRVMDDFARGSPADNTHWLPQSKIIKGCGVDRFNTRDVDFVGLLGSDIDVNGQVKKMLEMGHVEDAARLADKYFPPDHVKGHSSNAQSRVENFYRNRTIIEAVAYLYRGDYVMLHLPKPAIAKGISTKAWQDVMRNGPSLLRAGA